MATKCKINLKSITSCAKVLNLIKECLNVKFILHVLYYISCLCYLVFKSRYIPSAWLWWRCTVVADWWCRLVNIAKLHREWFDSLLPGTFVTLHTVLADTCIRRHCIILISWQCNIHCQRNFRYYQFYRLCEYGDEIIVFLNLMNFHLN